MCRISTRLPCVAAVRKRRASMINSRACGECFFPFFFFFFLFFLSTQRISSPSSIHPDLAFRLHGFRTLSPFPPPFVSSKVHARYPGYQLIIRPAPFSIIDRRSRSIGHPFAWVISVTRIVPSSPRLDKSHAYLYAKSI